jgi:hypothetical protein
MVSPLAAGAAASSVPAAALLSAALLSAAALLSVVSLLLPPHPATMVATMLAHNNALKTFFFILKILPSRFTFMEFIQAASEVGITRPSAARILAQAVSLEVLKKGKKEYRKVKTPVKKGL